MKVIDVLRNPSVATIRQLCPVLSSYKAREVISVIFRSQVLLRVHCCKREEAYVTTLLWQNKGLQNGLISRMLFSQMCKIMANKVTFVGFRGEVIAPMDPPLV